MEQILLLFIKWYSSHKSVSKFTPKMFYDIDPWCNIHNTSFYYLFTNWALKARVFHYTKLDKSARVKPSILQGPFESYVEREVL